MLLKNNIFGVIWTIIIIVLCGIPGDNLPESSFWGNLPIDKIVHGVLYFILYLLVYEGLSRSKVSYAKLISIVYCIMLGIIVEWLQANYFTGRSGDIYDILANISGTILGWLSFNFLREKAEKRFFSKKN